MRKKTLYMVRLLVMLSYGFAIDMISASTVKINVNAKVPSIADLNLISFIKDDRTEVNLLDKEGNLSDVGERLIMFSPRWTEDVTITAKSLNENSYQVCRKNPDKQVSYTITIGTDDSHKHCLSSGIPFQLSITKNKNFQLIFETNPDDFECPGVYTDVVTVTFSAAL